MGIRFACPNGHKLNVKDELAGKRGICPDCGAKFVIPRPGDTPGSARPPTATPPSPTPLAPSGRSPTSPAPTKTPAGAASPVAEPSLPPLPADAPPAAPVTMATDEPPPMLTTADADTSRVARYLAHRRRSRQNQVTLAILLLVTVVILVVVLLWVLQRGPATSAETPTTFAICNLQFAISTTEYGYAFRPHVGSGIRRPGNSLQPREPTP